MAKCFKRFKAVLRKAEAGCVFCHLDFSDVGCYDTFWRGYSDGSLSDTLTRELITDDMRAAEGGADLYIHVRVLDSVTEDGDFSDQDPSGTAGRGPPHPGASREHSGQGPPAPGSSNHGDETTPGYHGDGTGGQQVSGGGNVIQVKQEPAEQVPSCCMMGTVKSEMDALGMEVKEESSELDRQFAAIADHLGSMWERLASSLGFNTDYIRDLTARLPPSLRPHQLICDWMERNVGDVTLEQLVQALRVAGIHEVADAADSGQLFQTEADCDAAKGKPDDETDTDRTDADETSPKKQENSDRISTTSSSSDDDSDDMEAEWNDGEESSTDRSPDDTDSKTSGWTSDGSHGNTEGGALWGRDESMSDVVNSASHSRMVSPSMYPTGEDAMAWNDCIQDFFKTDEDTARSIQQSWPSNLLVKHLIRDRFFHTYLCEYWQRYEMFPDTSSKFVEFIVKACARHFSVPNDVSEEEFESSYESLCLVLGKAAYENESNNKQCLVHPSQLEWDDIHQSSLGLLQPISEDHDDTGPFQFVHDSIRQFLIAKWVVHKVTANTKLRNSVKKSAALPLSCYCVAHLLGQPDNHRDHLLQFVNLLMQSHAADVTFEHKLHVVTTTVESKQVDLLTPVVEALFPEKTLDLLSLPEISFHGLHSLINFMSKTRAIRDIKLPSELKYTHLLKMYPFSKSKSAKSVSHQQQIRCLSYLPLFKAESQHAESLYFKRTDKDLVEDHIQQYLLHCPLLTALTVQKEEVDINGLSKMAPYFLFAPSLSTLTLHNTKFSSSSLEDVKRNAQLVSARCLALCRDLNILNLTYFHIIDLPPLPNLEEIDLSHNSISDEVVSGLAEGFGSCQNLKKVNLSYNMLSGRGDFLPPLPNLEEIDLSHNAISDEAAPGLAECLGSCKKLKKVNLSHNKLYDRGDFLPPLPNLEEIYLSNNAISDEAVSGLVEILTQCPRLRTVHFSNNNISNKGALMLLLERSPQVQVEISNNYSISPDLQSLLSRRTDASQVTKLNLTSGEFSWQDRDVSLPVTAVPLLLQFLPQLPNLQELALCVSCQGEEEAEHISQLYGVRHLLKKLKLKDWSLDNMIRLSTQMFQHLPLLEEIDLSHNAISDAAVPGLAEGLDSCQNLKKVNLSDNKLSDVGELAASFINLPNLISVHINYNSISDESLPTIAAWLKVRTDVEIVYLRGNRFSAEGVRDFVRTMKGKAYVLDTLLYDGSQADVGGAVESGGEDVRREEQQWERLRRETDWIRVEVGQLWVWIEHKGRRSNNVQLTPL